MKYGLMRSNYCRISVSGSLLATLLLAGCGDGNGNAQPQMPPPAVGVAPVTTESVSIAREYTGRVRGAREVDVRARAGGILEERLYHEGETVQTGEPLFRIDPEPYAIALRRAEAEAANARAGLSQAQREWRRISGLFERDAVSERERDSALSALELAEARVALVEAGVEEARLNLEYTEVQAPISGITGIEALSEGSLLERGTLLTTITQTDPVQVRFSLPEADGATLRATQRRDGFANGEATLILPGGRTYGLQGSLDFTDITVDPRTGTVSARAVFDNPDGELVPGQFVRLRLVLDQLDDVVVIDPGAVGQGSQGPRVFVLGEENRAAMRNITLGPIMDRGQVVLSGLQPGDEVIVSGHIALQDGMPVRPQSLAQE